jgi:hypothetical protein
VKSKFRDSQPTDAIYAEGPSVFTANRPAPTAPPRPARRGRWELRRCSPWVFGRSGDLCDTSHDDVVAVWVPDDD